LKKLFILFILALACNSCDIPLVPFVEKEKPHIKAINPNELHALK
jgi:hypothetical protein